MVVGDNGKSNKEKNVQVGFKLHLYESLIFAVTKCVLYVAWRAYPGGLRGQPPFFEKPILVEYKKTIQTKKNYLWKICDKRGV